MKLLGSGWRSGPVRVAGTRRQRWRGLRPRPDGRGMLFATRAVHTLGMAEGLRVVSLDAGGRVRRTAVLPPGRLWFDGGARWVLELPWSRPAPAVGECLALLRPSPPGSG